MTSARSGRHQGSFFHHFKSKDELAVAAAGTGPPSREAFCASARIANCRTRWIGLLGYVDSAASCAAKLSEYTCLLGYAGARKRMHTRRDPRRPAYQGFSLHIAELTRDIEAARQSMRPPAWSAERWGISSSGSAGSFIFAKARQARGNRRSWSICGATSNAVQSTKRTKRKESKNMPNNPANLSGTT